MFPHLSISILSPFYSLIVGLLVWSIWINHQSLALFPLLFPSRSLALPPIAHPAPFQYITDNLHST